MIVRQPNRPARWVAQEGIMNERELTIHEARRYLIEYHGVYIREPVIAQYARQGKLRGAYKIADKLWLIPVSALRDTFAA